jgi:hypothetical protein
MTVDRENASPKFERDLSGRTLVIIVVALVGLAWAIYRPERVRPFYMTDFSELLPLLDSDHVVARTKALVNYYASQGRFNVVAYAWMAIKWTLVGGASPGWQLMRSVLMLTLFGLTFVLLRRLGASRLGGLIGASVFFFAPSASDGWVHLTMGEPLGAAVALSMSLLATRFQGSAHWQRDALLMSAGATILILTKELLAPLLVLPVFLALTLQPDGAFSRPARSQRNIGLVFALGAASLLAMLPVVWLYLRGDESAYASMYGRGTLSLGGILANWTSTLVPFDLVVFAASVPWALAVAGFFGLVGAGWRIGFLTGGDTKRAPWLLAISFIVPLVGVLAYVPNPWYARFYSLPMLIGTALFVGMAATYVHQWGPRGPVWAVGAWIAMSVFAIGSAGGYAAARDAAQRGNDRLISIVADSIDVDSVHVAVTQLAAYEWLGFGALMNRFAAATGRPWPLTRDIDCGQAHTELASRARLAILNPVSSCALRSPELKVIRTTYKRLNWTRLQIVEDSVHMDLIVLPAPQRQQR